MIGGRQCNSISTATSPVIRTSSPPHQVPKRSSGLPETVDVLIVGGGPAGMLLAAQLRPSPASAQTRRASPRPAAGGQANGVACRTVEMFDAFGLSAKLVRESYWSIEAVFWRPSPKDRSKIVRTGRIQDTEDGLSEFPHLIVKSTSPTAVPPELHGEAVRNVGNMTADGVHAAA